MLEFVHSKDLRVASLAGTQTNRSELTSANTLKSFIVMKVCVLRSVSNGSSPLEPSVGQVNEEAML